MAENVVQLTYRELAERLGISPDAARMKAKRAAKSGRWRVIAGNHPSDPVRVELPAQDVQDVGGEQVKRSTPERKTRTPDRTPPDATLTALQTAQEHLRAVTSQLTEEMERHRATAVELGRTEAKVETLQAEIIRLAATIDQLQDELQAERRTWWQRLTGR